MTETRTPWGRFSYALVSAALLQDSAATGIAVILKAHDRSTVKTICIALETADPLAAAYEAVMIVLDEALAAGVGRPAIYIDNTQVVEQLEGRQQPPRELLATNLRARARINQVGRPRLIAATRSERFSARQLAESAVAPRSVSPRQLSLMSEEAPT